MTDRSIKWPTVSRRRALRRLAALGGTLAASGLAAACRPVGTGPAPTAVGSKPAEAAKPTAAVQTAPAGQPAGGSAVTIKFSHEGTESHQNQVWGQKFAETLAETSKGQVAVQLFPNAQLGKNKENLEAMQTGSAAVQMVASAAQDTATWVPDIDAMDLPFLFTSVQHQFAVLDGEIGQSIQKKWEEHNWKGVGWGHIGVRHITNNKLPIASLDDLKGLKLRVQGTKVNIETWKALGTTPVPMAFADVYLALKQNTVDGQENPTTTIRVQNYFEAQKYLSMSGHAITHFYAIMDLRFFQRLSPEIQQMILEAGTVAGDHERTFVLEDEAKSREFLVGKGMIENTIADLEPFRKAVAGVAEVVGGPVPALAAKIRDVRV